MKHIVSLWILLFFVSCQPRITDRVQVSAKIPVFPDFSDCVVPVNIAPLNFEVMKRCEEVEVVFSLEGKTELTCRGDQYLNIPLRPWKELLQKAVRGSGQVSVIISCLNKKKWEEYLPLTFRVAPEAIDEWIAYRLIYPGYEGWAQMGLYQRNLTGFQEKTILDNRMTGSNCMNCHCFDRYSSGHFVFHMRGKIQGTLMVEGKQCKMVNEKLNGSSVPLVYPAWHPSGRFIAFSSNATMQFFHAVPDKQIEVYDKCSDIVLYNTRTNSISTDSTLLAAKTVFETYPAWAPAGDRLYFCRADSVTMPQEYKRVQYVVCAVGFDSMKACFSGPVDTVLRIPGKSVVFPRISPDGRYLLATTLDYGCFPVWHKEADLILWDIRNRKIIPHDANSFEAESYHSWSSNGRWVMFCSRRADSYFTRLWFSYADENGRLHKPFLLPQQGRMMRDIRMKSYNVPEFITGPVTISPRKLLKAAKGS